MDIFRWSEKFPHSLQRCRRRACSVILGLCLLLFCILVISSPSYAQWNIITDGDPLPESFFGERDTTLTLEQNAIRQLNRQGYLYAVTDSLDIFTQTIFVSRGNRAQLEKVTLLGVNTIESSMIPLSIRPGDWITSSSLKKTAESILDHYFAEGYLLAEVIIEAIIPIDSVRHEVIMRVQEGTSTPLERVILQGARRTQLSYVYHVTGFVLGQILKQFDPEQIQRKLQASGLFSRVDLPVLYRERMGGCDTSITQGKSTRCI